MAVNTPRGQVSSAGFVSKHIPTDKWSDLISAAAGVGLGGPSRPDISALAGPTETWVGVEQALRYQREAARLVLLDRITAKDGWHANLLPFKTASSTKVDVIVEYANEAVPAKLPQYVPAPLVTTSYNQFTKELERYGLALDIDTESLATEEGQANLLMKLHRLAAAFVHAIQVDVLSELAGQQDYVIAHADMGRHSTSNRRAESIFMSNIALFGLLNQDSDRAMTGWDELMASVMALQQRRMAGGKGDELNTVVVPSGVVQNAVFQRDLFIQDRPTFQDKMALTVGKDDGPTKGASSRYFSKQFGLYGYTSPQALSEDDPARNNCFVATWAPMECRPSGAKFRTGSRTIKITDGNRGEYSTISLIDAIAHTGVYQDQERVIFSNAYAHTDATWATANGHYQKAGDGLVMPADSRKPKVPPIMFGLSAGFYGSTIAMGHMADNIISAAGLTPAQMAGANQYFTGPGGDGGAATQALRAIIAVVSPFLTQAGVAGLEGAVMAQVTNSNGDGWADGADAYDRALNGTDAAFRDAVRDGSLPGEHAAVAAGFSGIRRAALFAYMRSENTLPNIRAQLARGLDFPYNIRIVRPAIEVVTANAFFMHRGERTGNTYYMMPFLASEATPTIQKETVQVTVWFKAIVKQPFNVMVLRHVHLCEIIDGFGARWMSGPQDYKGLIDGPRGGRSGDMYAMIVPVGASEGFADQNVVSMSTASNYAGDNEHDWWGHRLQSLVQRDPDYEADGDHTAPSLATRGTYIHRQMDGSWSSPQINHQSHLKARDSVEHCPSGAGTFLDRPPPMTV